MPNQLSLNLFKMKLHYSFYILLFLIIPFSSSAKSKEKYPISDIPDELLSNAHAVVRKATTIYEYNSPSDAVETNYFAITILKESALGLAEFAEGYDKLMKINNIEGNIYDKDGKHVKRIKQEDIKDYSSISGASLYEDNRVKYIDPEYNTYPFTIEYSYVRKYQTTMFSPSWSPFNGYNVPVQETSFTFLAPSGYKLNYKCNNMSVDPILSESDGIAQYKWEIINYDPPKDERNKPSFYTWAPMVFTSPASFEIQGYAGSFNTWKDFGIFNTKLLEGMDNVPQETLKEVKTLLNDQMDDYEKIQTIHRFAQKKNRYISIQVGIGGWQPFDAEIVDKCSYGDCKALTNYTMALLKDNGFKCHYTLVSAGNDIPLDPIFANNRFNHAFLCVPLENDTVWVECTSPHTHSGYISDFTDDRYVLLIDGENSRLVKTPMYSAKENAQHLNANIIIDADGNAKGNFTFEYTGAKFSDQFYLTIMDEKDRKKRILTSIDLPNFTLESYKIDVDNSRYPSLKKHLDINMQQYATKMGNRFLIQLNSINDQTYIPPYARKREMPLYFRRNFSENDTVKIQIPEKFKVEAIPEPVEINKEFASFKCKTEVEDNSIIYYREFIILKGQYPKEQYNEFRDFLEKVAKADASSAIIKPKAND